MNFWQWLDDNWVKSLSSLGALNSALIGAVAAGMFTGLLSVEAIKWLAIFGFFMNVFLVSVGYRNTTEQKVAHAKVQVAKALETAIQSTPPVKTEWPTDTTATARFFPYEAKKEE